MEEALKCFKQFFGKKPIKSAKDLILHIGIVDSGYKPSYLLDCLSTNMDSLHRFIEKLHREGLIENQLCCVELEDTIFIYRPAVLANCLDNTNYALVDVSYTLKQPVLVQDQQADIIVKEMLNLLKTEIICNEKMSIQLPRDMNRSSLYGLMLGYPVVYWYNTCDAGSNCLSMEPLRVHNITCKLWKHTAILYAFSYPVVLKNQLACKVEKWLKDLQSICKTKCNISEEQFSCLSL